MALKSKRYIVSMAAGVLAIIAYLVYALGGAAPKADDLAGWAIAMLIFIGIAVAAQVLMQVAFHVAVVVGIMVKAREKDDKAATRIINAELRDDERDKRIGLRSAHIGYIFAGVGFVSALVAFACGASAVAGLHILLAAGALACFVEGIIGVYLYERGNAGCK